MNPVTWVNRPQSSLVHVLNNDGLPCPPFLVACLQSARLDDVALVWVASLFICFFAACLVYVVGCF
ncbi:unnamed protein product [Prunus brigantina]